MTQVEVGSRIGNEEAKKLCKVVFSEGEKKISLPGVPLAFRFRTLTEEKCEEELEKITGVIDSYGGDYVVRQIDERGLTLACAS